MGYIEHLFTISPHLKKVYLYGKTGIMAHDENGNEDALNAALGTPKYYVDAPGKKEGEKYYWFPTQGDSMTDHTPGSIPAGSLVLGRWLPLSQIHDTPLHRPIVIILDDNGQQFCILKITTHITPATDTNSGLLWLRSYNPRYKDFSLPFPCVKFIFEVERVRLPDGREFIPQQKTDDK